MGSAGAMGESVSEVCVLCVSRCVRAERGTARRGDQRMVEEKIQRSGGDSGCGFAAGAVRCAGFERGEFAAWRGSEECGDGAADGNCFQADEGGRSCGWGRKVRRSAAVVSGSALREEQE